ncbi:MAG: GTP-binding protein [Cytophagia bacterium]|nr:GTP-binding protein [Cytophagia bacterium]
MDVLRIATAGSVDDGKSTLIGRLLYETNSITSDKLEAIEKASLRKGIGFVDLSLLTDGLIAEREQGITIDVAHIYFNTPKRKFIIADTPGHVEYTRNMITGASKANASLILIDARKGIVEQTHRHFHIASLLRIPTVVVCINKMDLVQYDQKVFENIKSAFIHLVEKTEGYRPAVSFVPLSSLHGDNLTSLSDNTPWYKGTPLLETLETIKTGEERVNKASRMPVQYVVRPRSNEFHDFRAYAGRLSSGKLKVGDEVTALPSGRKSKITKLFQYQQELDEVKANQSFTLMLEDNIDISRGDMLVRTEEAPTLKNEFSAQCCWLNNANLSPENRLEGLCLFNPPLNNMATEIEHFRNLVSLSAADGKIDEAERIALAKIAYEKGIPLDRMNVMLNRATEYIYLIPQNMVEREKQLIDMIAFATVDGEFSKAELELITTVSEKLGFNKEELDGYLKNAGYQH